MPEPKLEEIPEVKIKDNTAIYIDINLYFIYIAFRVDIGFPAKKEEATSGT